VDGGGSKVDAALLDTDGSVIAAIRHRNTDLNGSNDAYLEGVAGGVAALRREAALPEEGPIARAGMFCLAGADLPADDRRIIRWLRGRDWTGRDLVRNDTFAVLRAGTERRWGVAVVCGHGTNCSGVAPGGRTYRFPAVGAVSGDWGGGQDIGSAALWYALRAKDGRGEPTALATLVPAHFGMRRPRQVMEAMYFGRVSEERLVELPPVVFRAAAAGDAVARQILDRQADEVIAMAGAAIRKLGMTRLDVDVVLGGGIFRGGDPPFFGRIDEGLARVAPRVRVRRLTAPPVVGAALLGLDELKATSAAKERAREVLTHDFIERRGSRPRSRVRETVDGGAAGNGSRRARGGA
jgi:N-acetylglucosamine kinase-like BadF-type ATPase